MAKKKRAQYHGVTRELRHLRHDEIPNPLLVVPEEAVGLYIDCEGCGGRIFPPWHQRLPVELLEEVTDDGKIRVPGIINLKCPRCGQLGSFSLPLAEPLGQIDFFGDESEQVFQQDGRIFVYALIAFTPELLTRATDAMREAKRKIRPTVDPASWQFHAQSVRQSEWRAENGVTLPYWEVDKAILSLATFLGDNDRQRFISVTCLPPCRTLFSTEQLFERVLMIALLSTTQMATGIQYSPRFFLEARGDDHTKNRIDYAVERIGRGFRHSLTFLYVSRGMTTGIPVTVPGIGTELEFADLIAFVARRQFYRVVVDKPVELPTSALGPANWTIIRSDGSFFSKSSRGIPDIREPSPTAPRNTSG